MRIASDDMEQQMEVIRYFCRSYALRVAACEVTDMMPLMQVSDYLTWIAEAVVEHVVNIAWDQLVASHGLPALITAGATNSHTQVLLLWPTVKWAASRWATNQILIWCFYTVAIPGAKPMALAA